MKKSISKLFSSIVLVLCVAVFFSTPVLASLGVEDVEAEVSFFINIYDEERNEFFLPNIEIAVPVGTTISKSMDILKEKKLIADFKRSDSMVTSISFVNGTVISVSPPPDTKLIYVKHNGAPELTSKIDNIIEDGDIVEWIYGPPIKTTASEGSNSTQGDSNRVNPILWEDEYQAALSAGCEFLELNKENETSYLVAMGVANKTLDTKMINNLLSRLRRTAEYDSAKDLAGLVLSLTFAGYDASELVESLSEYTSSEITVEDAIYTLLAYDCNRYAVLDTATNSRDNVLKNILATQDYDGKFKGNRATASITTTAMALAAISPYSQREEVKEAIDRAVEYLSSVQTESGMFRENGVESAFTLSKVIIGLVSSNVSLEDERFVKKEKNLIQLLLEHQKADGGFFDSADKNSTVFVTEQAVIALATVKKNNYPYYVAQTLVKIKTQEAPQIILPSAVEITPYSFSLGVIVIIISMVAVIISFIKKYNPNNNKIL